jgi:hypothetical protein
VVDNNKIQEVLEWLDVSVSDDRRLLSRTFYAWQCEEVASLINKLVQERNNDLAR